jgi:hypothetical protein
MACTSQLSPAQTLAQRMAEVDRALKRLAQQIASGKVQLKIGPTGSIAFQGWADNDRISDTCAYRALLVSGSWELKQAVMKAEAVSGRKVNPQAVAAGHHSHDGHTWHKGH